jgi:hypothetical protein
VDRVVGLDGVRVDVAMLETQDGHGRLGLMKFHAPPARGGDRDAPANTLGIRRIAFAAPTARRRRCSSRGRIAQRDGAGIGRGCLRHGNRRWRGDGLAAHVVVPA